MVEGAMIGLFASSESEGDLGFAGRDSRYWAEAGCLGFSETLGVPARGDGGIVSVALLLIYTSAQSIIVRCIIATTIGFICPPSLRPTLPPSYVTVFG